MIRSFLLHFALILIGTSSLHGMMPDNEAAPGVKRIATIRDVVRNDIYSGEYQLISAAWMVGLVSMATYFKSIVQTFDHPQISQDMTLAIPCGVTASIFLLISLVGIACKWKSAVPTYKEQDFMHSETAFQVREGFRIMSAMLFSLIVDQAIQTTVANMSNSSV